MTDIQKHVLIRTARTSTIQVNRRALLEMLRQQGMTIPDSAVVHFTVPRGGDYSGEDVDISDANPVWVRWTETQESEK